MTLCELLLWTLVLSMAVAGRFLGSWIGRRIGARHAVAWFGAFAGFSVALLGSIFVMHVMQHPDRSVGSWSSELKDGPLPGCFIYGATAALIIEALASFVEWAIASLRREAVAEPAGARRPRPPLLKSILVVVVLGGIVFANYQISTAPWLRWRRAYRRTLSLVDGLAQRRPNGVTRKQWAWVVGWTHDAVCNCLSIPSYITDEERYYRFVDELERAVRGEITMSTIDWIWDEFEGISKNGKSYSENWRPTTPKHFREADTDDFGIDVP